MIIKTPTEATETAGRIIGSSTADVFTGIGMAALIKNWKALVQNNKVSLTNLTTNIAYITYTLYRYYFGNFAPNTPAAVIAGIPLGTVEELSWAISDLDLKYRAAKGIFLAHQEPGDQSLRITCKAFGVNRFWLLSVIELLFEYGSAKRTDQFKNILTGTAEVPPLAVAGTSQNPWQEFDAYADDQGIEERHLTFPVITKNRIFTSMYIETYDFTESIEMGMNCLTFELFFRKYVPTYPIRYAIRVPEEGENRSPTIFYSEDDTSEEVSLLKAMDLFLEFGYSLAMITYRSFMILAGNNVERNIALCFGIGLNESNYGINKYETVLKERIEGLTENDSLSGLSTKNVEELFQLD